MKYLPSLLAGAAFLWAASAYAQPPCAVTLTQNGTGATIQAALNSAPLYTAVCLGAGTTFTVSQTIVVPNQKSIVGVGPSNLSATVRAAPTFYNDLIYAYLTSGHHFANFSVLGNQSSTASGGSGIVLLGTHGAYVEQMHIANTKGMGVYVDGGSTMTIADNDFGFSGLPNDLYPTPNLHMTNMTVAWVRDNHFLGRRNGNGPAQADGGSAFYNSTDLEIYDNFYDGDGLYLAGPSGCHRVNIWGNTFEDTEDFPLDIVMGTSDVFISSNIITGAKWSAAVVSASHDVHFEWNVFMNNNVMSYSPCQGISISAPNGVSTSTNVTLANNTIYPGPNTCLWNH